jgi:hypothetical protein
MKLGKCVRGALLGLSVLVGSHGGATTREILDLARMVDAADAIVIGHCRTAESVWHEGSLLTRYTFEVDERLKGSGEAEVSVVVPGGVDLKRAVPVATAVPGAPIFIPGEHVVLMLKSVNRPREGDFDVVGFNQGRFTIDERRVRFAASGAGLTAQPDEALDRFRQRVLDALDARGARPPLGAFR